MTHQNHDRHTDDPVRLRWLHIILIIVGLAVVLPSAYYLQRQAGRSKAYRAHMAEAKRRLESLQVLEGDALSPGISESLKVQRESKFLRNAASAAFNNALDPEAETEALELLAEAERRLKPGKYVVHNVRFVSNGDLAIDGERLPDSPRSYRISARPGQDLRITVNGRIFRYAITPGTPAELDFAISGYFYRVNGKLVGIELEGKGARRWLVSASPEELKDISYLCIGKMAPDEIAALKKIRNEGLIIDVTEGYLNDLLPVLPKLNPLALGLDESPSKNQLEELAKLDNLRILRLNNGSDLTDMRMLADFDNLHTLIVQSAYNLTKLDGVADISPDLTALELNQCANLLNVDGISEAVNLVSLTIPESARLQSYAPLAALPNLKHLTVNPIYMGSSWRTNPWVSKITDYLNIAPPEPKVSLDGLGRLSSLESLTLIENGLLTDIYALADLHELRELEIRHADMLEDITPIGELTKLERLDIAGARALDNISPLGQLRNLKDLDISSCVNISDFSFLENLTAIERLAMNNIRADNLDMLHHSGGNIHTFHAMNMRGQPNPVFLFDMNSLRILSLPMEGEQVFLEELSRKRPELTALWLYRNHRIVSLAPLARFSALEELAISDCPNLSDYDQLKNLSKLRDLALIRQPVEDLGFVAPLSRLTSLRILFGEELNNIDGLAALKGLRNLELTDCARLKDISALGSMPMLADLSLQGSESLTDISPLTAADRLVALNLLDCEKIRNLAPLNEMKQLTWLWLRSYNLSPSQIKNLPECRIVIP